MTEAEELLVHVEHYLSAEELRMAPHFNSLEEFRPLEEALHIVRSCRARLELERCGSRCICGTTPVEAGAMECPVHGYR